MPLPDVEAMLRASLDDPRVPAPARARVARVLAQTELGPDDLAEFSARAFVLARAAGRDPRMRDALAFLGRLAAMVAPAPAPAQKDAKKDENPPAGDHGAARSEAFFSPGDTCLRAIRAEFSRARHTADVCVYTITDDRIAEAVFDAHRRGVAVRVISDDEKENDEGSDVPRMRDGGIPVRIDHTEHHMHHKFAVFDGARVLTGSYNWTRSAANYNQENVVVSDDARLVAAFAREFDALWARFA